jgi:hypothetical protein
MLLSEAAAATTTSSFTGFDIFILLFTVILAVAMFRLVNAEKKNLFAIGFCFVSFAVFLVMDFIMISNWMAS